MTAAGGPAHPGPDSLGMWAATLGLPEQIEEARRTAAGVIEGAGALWGRPVKDVVILGMGGSAMAGEVAAAIALPRLSVPVFVVRSYRLPRFVGPGSLVLAVSFSGETEETLSAAGAAFDAGATVAVVASGGTLALEASERGAPVFPVPAGVPQPRAALGAMTVPLLATLEACGLLDARHLLDSAADQLRRRRDELASSRSPAEAVASAIGRSIPLVHGGEGPGAVAANRWRTQCNENAKIPAFSAVQPELCHNEAAGWGQHGDVTRQVLTLVSLRCPSDHPQVARRMDLVGELLVEVVHQVVEVRAEGTTDCAQLFDLVLVGDVVSLMLAGREGIDPGPVPVLLEIKAALAR